MIKIAIMGYGTVGSGVAEVLQKNTSSIAHKAGQPIEIGRILDLREFPGSPFANRFTKDFRRYRKRSRHCHCGGNHGWIESRL